MGIIVFLGWVWTGACASASTVLLHGSRKTPPQPVSVTTYGEKIEVRGMASQPGNALTVVWLGDALHSEASEQARGELMKLYSSLRGRGLKLAVVRDGAVSVAGPFASRMQLERAVPVTSPPGSQVAGLGVLDTLNANAARLGSKLSPVVIFGKLPHMEPKVQAYAQAVLAQSFETQQVRVFALSAPGSEEAWAPLCAGTGGAVAPAVEGLSPLLNDTAQSFLQVSWTAAEPPGGFIIGSATIRDAEAQPMIVVPDLATAPGASLPTIEKFAAMQEQLTQVSAWLREQPTETRDQKMRETVLSAQSVNPLDPDLLRIEALFGEQTQDFRYAAKSAGLWTVVEPLNGASFVLLAQTQLLTLEFDKAEAALNTAKQLNAPALQLAELSARVHLGRKEERAALPYLEEVLRADGKRQDLWLVQGETADKLHQDALARSSFEQASALGDIPVGDAITLIRLYVEAKDTDRAHSFSLAVLAKLPPDAEVRNRFARALEDDKLTTEALAAWRSVLAVQPASELGQVRVAQLLLETGDRKGSEEAAVSSLQNLPKSGALYLAKSDAIRQQGRIYEARSILEEGAAGTQDTAVLSRLAAAQEPYGDRAPEAYAALAKVTGQGSPERFRALERGFSLSLRDGSLKEAASFAALLDADGHPEYRALLGERRSAGKDAVIPGGLAAFGYIAHVKPGTPPERFLAEYARQVVSEVCTNNCMGDRYTAAIQSYFATIAGLEALGKRDGDRVSIKLSLNGKDEKNRVQSALNLLGLQIHNEKGQIRVDRGEKQSQGKKQDLVTALDIDQVGMEEALRVGKSFTFEIHDEYAAVYPSAKMWKESFPKLEQQQFALMLLRQPVMARLYVGISTLDRRTMQALIGTGGMYWYMGRSADLLSLYGTSFAVEGTQASVPGGKAAAAVWSQMAGASTDHPGAFYQALLQQKNPALLVYFYTLSHLDTRHQAFFTANLKRATRFYELFATLPESQALSTVANRESSFSELLRSVPIDDDGHVAFPGSPEVWTIAKGNAADDKHVASMMKKVSHAASADVEDDVLLRLAATRYKAYSTTGSELDNFLAVSRVNAHRVEPLDEESALMLAQHYSGYAAAYPYFAELRTINASGFRSFFNLVDGLSKQSILEQQLALGQLHSLIEWVVLMRRRAVINDAEAARLFTLICTRLSGAAGESDRTQAAIGLADAILTSCGHGAGGRWDDTLRVCLLGRTGDKNDPRGKDYEVVLDDQKAPNLENVRAIVSAAAAVLTSGGALHLSPIPQDHALLPSVPLPKDVKLVGREKEALQQYDPSRVQKLIEEWNLNAGKSTQDAKTLQTAQKIAGELLKAAEPQVTLALAAPLYAYFFRGGDRVVSEDALLLRKHRFFEFVSPTDQRWLMRQSEFVATSDGLGSHITGGFAQFGLASGYAVSAGWKQGGAGGAAVIAEEIAAMRSTTWELLQESDLRLLTLRILAAREWIVASEQSPKLFSSLSEETSGLLSLSRRADLLNGIEERDWQQVWKSITLPDLFRLGGSYLRRNPPGASLSPVTEQLLETAKNNPGTRMDMFGRIPNHVMGCSHTHLVADAPYEEYERKFDATYLAERTAEFKLFLAYRADSLGVQPADLPQAAEALAAKAFSRSQMTDSHDWRSLLSAYASITNADLKKALE